MPQILDALPFPVALLARDGAIEAVNEAGQTLAKAAFGQQVAVGRIIHDYLGEEDRASFSVNFARVVGGEPLLVEGPIGPSGRENWFDVRLIPLRSDTRSVSGVLVVLVGIDARREAHEALVRSERRFRAVLEHAVDGVTVVGTEGTIQYTSPAVERILGRTPAEMTGVSGFEYVHPDDLPVALALLRDTLAEPRRTHTAVFRMRRKDGSYAHIELVTSRLVDDPAFGGVVCNARDVSERYLLESRLRFADRMASLGTLAAGVAHEINNPLSFVVGGLEMIERAATAPGLSREAVREALAQVRDGVERVRRIVRDLKTFSRGEEDEARPRVLSVEDVLESALTLARSEIRHRARLVRAYEPAPPVLADEARLAQVFLSLLINAAQAIPDGAADENEIRVAVREADGRARVEITDTGVGIPADVLPRIFDPFFTTKPVGIGTGLGLSISHGIITDAGGEIRVRSENGLGTTFEITLPAAEERETPVRPEDAPDAPPARARILIVDDEPLAGQTLRLLLAEDHAVDVVTSGREALERLVREPGWDVVLCDLMMPDLTGADLHAALAEKAPAYTDRLIFITGGAFTTRARDFVETVANEVLEKPFTLAEVLAAVGRVLRRPRGANPARGA